MFNNLINIYDILLTFKKIKNGQMRKVFSKFLSGDEGKVEKTWTHTESPPKNWWNIPAVTRRWNYMISGDYNVDYYKYIAEKYLAGRKSLRALSLACGVGKRELKWAESGIFERIDAYDLSKARIEYAKRQAREMGYDNIVHYHVANVYDIDMSEGCYDIILAEQSLHHFSPLKDLLVRIHTSLKTDGYLIVNDFVGPTRFQWTDKQLNAINGLLAIIPEKYKKEWEEASIKT